MQLRRKLHVVCCLEHMRMLYHAQHQRDGESSHGLGQGGGALQAEAQQYVEQRHVECPSADPHSVCQRANLPQHRNHQPRSI